MIKIITGCMGISILMGGLIAFLSLVLWNASSPWNTTCIRMEREWGNYVYSMNMLPINAPSQILTNLQKQIDIPILGIEFSENMKPVRLYLINGQVYNVTVKG